MKLADLGLAKATLLRDQTRANVRKGTYAYMSPEQVAGAPLGPASDLFSAGVLLHELVSGVRTFDGDSPHATMQKIVQGEPTRHPSVPDDLRAVLATCFEKSPQHRIGDADTLRKKIDALQAQRADSMDLVRWFF